MRYPSAKSAGFNILMSLVILVLIISTIIIPIEYRALSCVGFITVAAFMLWVWFGTFYEFREKFLLARMGPFQERIPYERITSAVRTQSMASSMALSSNMIELRHGKNYVTGTTLISPRDMDVFLSELSKRCPCLDQAETETENAAEQIQ